MTEELMKSILEAEENASKEKRIAMEKAEQIIFNAEQNALRLEKTSIEVCKAYKETQIKQAQEDAERAYQASLKEAKINAKAYCEKALQEAEPSVEKIIGRVIRGGC